MFCWTVHVKVWQQPDGVPTVAVENEVYCFGGPYNGNQIDVHVFNTASLRWRKLSPVTTGRERHLEVPPWRRGHTAVLVEDIVYVWGGYPYCKWLYTFDVDAQRWFKPRVSGTVSWKRFNHSACVLGKVIYILGGRALRRYCYDIYKLEATSMVWSLINTGGTYPHPLPSSHCDHSAFTYNGALYIFGGLDYYEKGLNDLWKFNPETFSWKKVEPKGKGPGPMYGMCCCMLGDCIILFGGENTPDDLFILDLSPSLKTLCRLSVIQYGLEQSGLPHNIRWELAATTGNMFDRRRRQKRGISKDKKLKEPGGNMNIHKQITPSVK